MGGQSSAEKSSSAPDALVYTRYIKEQTKTKGAHSCRTTAVSTPQTQKWLKAPSEVKTLSLNNTQKGRMCNERTTNVVIFQHARTAFPPPPTQYAYCCLCTHSRSHFERSVADIRDTPLSRVADTMTVCLRMTFIEGTTAPPWTLVPPAGPDLTARALWSNSSTISFTCTGRNSNRKKQAEI